jgi:hypothetical protein
MLWKLLEQMNLLGTSQSVCFDGFEYQITSSCCWRHFMHQSLPPLLVFSAFGVAVSVASLVVERVGSFLLPPFFFDSVDATYTGAIVSDGTVFEAPDECDVGCIAAAVAVATFICRFIACS